MEPSVCISPARKHPPPPFFATTFRLQAVSYANATLGVPCIIDSTVYIGLGPNGEQFSTTVSRDNCKSPGLYCNPTSDACEKTQAIGQACQNDQECQSVSIYNVRRAIDAYASMRGQYNCNMQNICAVPPATPLKVAIWQYVLTGLAVLMGK
jgi:hypothetical protein